MTDANSDISNLVIKPVMNGWRRREDSKLANCASQEKDDSQRAREGEEYSCLD
jgi:hypothetical protein